MEVKINKDKLTRAIKNNPITIRNNALRYMNRSISALKRTIMQNRWQIGSYGGGVPVASGNLKKAHRDEIGVFRSRIWVDKNRTQAGRWNYADLVHDGTSKMEARPWLEFAKNSNKRLIESYGRDFVKAIINNLAKK